MAGNPQTSVYDGLTTADGKWCGVVRTIPSRLIDPIRWRRPRMIFVCSMSDLFHETTPEEFIDEVFAAILAAPRHIFQLLTKRPQNMAKYFKPGKQDKVVKLAHKRYVEFRHHFADYHGEWPPSNAWLGVTAENQKCADERIPMLLQTPAAVHFVSAEPLLEPIDFTGWLYDFQKGEPPEGIARIATPPLSWVICGGESGPHARPCHPSWVRRIRDDCREAGVPWFFKGWGEYVQRKQMTLNQADLWRAKSGNLKDDPWADRPDEFLRLGKKAAGCTLDGRTWNEFPESL